MHGVIVGPFDLVHRVFSWAYEKERCSGVSKAWKGGSTRAWRRTRERVLRRDGYVCGLQEYGCLGDATEVHHIRGKNDGGGDEDGNLVAACSVCHARHTREQQITSRRPRPTKRHPGLID